MRKSYIAAFVLALCFGPLGLLYTSIAAALGFIIVGTILMLGTCAATNAAFGAVIMVAMTGNEELLQAAEAAGVSLIALLFCVWGLSIIVNLWLVSRHNAKLTIEENRHREIVRAAAGRH